MANSSYCISFDDETCYKDSGSLCNYTGNTSAWCNILNETSNCPTIDGSSCYNPWEGMYVTYDNITTSPIVINQTGSYCYSTNGYYCDSNYGLYCNQSTGYMCTTYD